jgi:uncharacterized protein (DUF4415 family)
MRASKRKSRTDWAKVDAHEIAPEEYEESPEWTDDMFARAEIAIGGKIIRPAQGTLTRRGRPKKANAKVSVHLRLSPEVLAHFRARGPGWQTRIDETLRKAVKLSARKRPATKKAPIGRSPRPRR